MDVKLLQKVEPFAGKEVRWRDWPVVFRAAARPTIPGLGAAMKKLERSPDHVWSVYLSPEEEYMSVQLYSMLVLVCRGQALDIVVNAGEQDGFEAWRLLAFKYEGRERAGYVGQLVALLCWTFEGDFEQWLEAFEREVADYARSGETVSDAMKIGIVTRSAPEGDMKRDPVMNAERLHGRSSVRRSSVSAGHGLRPQLATVGGGKPNGGGQGG